jgi:hypothetical protein
MLDKVTQTSGYARCLRRCRDWFPGWLNVEHPYPSIGRKEVLPAYSGRPTRRNMLM